MTPDSRPPHSPAEPTTAGPTPVEVVRSEERLRVGSQVRVSGRAVLRRYVVTETVTQTFQVRHEEVRLEHLTADQLPPAHETDPAAGRDAFDDRVVEMILHREVPVVQLEVVATERVRLRIATISGATTVSAEVARDEVAVDVVATEEPLLGPAPPRGRAAGRARDGARRMPGPAADLVDTAGARVRDTWTQPDDGSGEPQG